MDVLPAEEPRVDGPGARSHHRQACAEHSEPDRNAGIAGVRESDPKLGEGQQRSGDRRPQTDEKKKPGRGRNDLRRGRRKVRCCSQVDDAMMKERGARQQPLEQQASAGPTVRKSRK